MKYNLKGEKVGLLGGVIRKGSWWVSSKIDPRWNANGRGIVGGFVMPSEAKDFIDKKKKELNEQEPSDLEYGYMKD